MMRPVGVGLWSAVPMGVVGLRMRTDWPVRAASMATCSARNLERL